MGTCQSDIKLLYPGFAFLILKLFVNAHKEGLRVCVFETYRSQERQIDLFNQGRSKIKKNGMHHFGIAADLVFRDKVNNPIWRGDWDKLGQIGRDLGLFWGGDWQSFRDCPHFQLIPALWENQSKIKMGVYPTYDKKIDSDLEKLIPAYESVKNSGYSDDKLNELLQQYNNINNIPTLTNITKDYNFMRLIQNSNSKKIYAIGSDRKKHWIFNEETFYAGRDMGLWKEQGMNEVEVKDDDDFEAGHVLILIKN